METLMRELGEETLRRLYPEEHGVQFRLLDDK
jgi:hypothetical protein